MRFRRAVQRYGRTAEPQTPYQRAAQMWDERIGSARVQARNWRLMALGGLVLSTGLSAGLLWQSGQSRITPYVVEVDRLGDARAVAPADRQYRPTDPQIAWHLAKFITDVRSISLDPVLMRENWLSAYDFVTARGAKFLGDYARSSNPFGSVGTRTVSVEVTSVVRASDQSFELKWTQAEFDRGSLVGTSRWTAILSIVVRPPVSAETLRRNPLGLYVDGIDWTRELDTNPPAAPPRARHSRFACPTWISARPRPRGELALDHRHEEQPMRVALLSLLCIFSATSAQGTRAPERIRQSARVHVHKRLARNARRAAAVSEALRPAGPDIDRFEKSGDEAANGPPGERPRAFTIGAMTVYFWREGEIYRLETRPDEVSDIALQAGEALVSVAAGDTVRWIIGDTTSGSGAARRAHVLVKPSAAGLSTNLMIATDRRVYHIALESSAREGMSSIGWTYPEGELLTLKASIASAREPAVSDGLPVERLNFNYRIEGDDVPWRPVRAFDDGRQVFIEFPPSIGEHELPPLFIRGEDGKAELVNYHVRGRYYLVDRLFGIAEMRLGEKHQAIVRIVRDGPRGLRRSS